MKVMTVRVADEEKEKIEKYAKENDLSASQVIRKAIKEFLGKI